MTNPKSAVETSAARLLSILREARATDMGLPAMSMWCQVFGIEMGSNDDAISGFFRSAADLVTLSGTVKHQITALVVNEHEDVDFALEDYHKIETVMGRFPGIATYSMQQFIDQFDRDAERCLRHMDTMLKRNRVFSPSVSDETIKNLREKIADAISATLDAPDLDDGTKKTIIELLHRVDDAVRDAKVSGVVGITHGYDATVGGFLRQPLEWLRRVTDSKSTFEAITKAMTAVGAVVALATPAYHTIENTWQSDPTPAIEQQHVAVVPEFVTLIQDRAGTFKITNLSEPRGHGDSAPAALHTNGPAELPSPPDAPR